MTTTRAFSVLTESEPRSSSCFDAFSSREPVSTPLSECGASFRSKTLWGQGRMGRRRRGPSSRGGAIIRAPAARLAVGTDISKGNLICRPCERMRTQGPPRERLRSSRYRMMSIVEVESSPTVRATYRVLWLWVPAFAGTTVSLWPEWEPLTVSGARLQHVLRKGEREDVCIPWCESRDP